jgi:hypothetical protein
MAPNLFRVLLALVALYALLRGHRDERQAVAILVIGVIATELVLPPVRERFGTIEIKLMLVDLAVFCGFLWVALRSERFWPLWVAGLQLTSILGHILKAVDSDLFSRAYAAALVFWFYPMLLILAIGTWRSHKRGKREHDPQPA